MRAAALCAAPLAAAAATAAPRQLFLSIGDWGGSVLPGVATTAAELANGRGMAAVADRCAFGAAFVLALGDNFYPLGIVGDEGSAQFQKTFELAFAEPELQVPWHVVAGNHDHYGNVTAQIAYSAHSSRWDFPALYYTFNSSFESSTRTVTTQVVYIDTVTLAGDSFHDDDTGEFRAPQGPVDAAAAQTQLEWLEQTLAASTADYLWVAGHYPIYSVCQHGPTQQLIDGVLPLLQKYNVSGYISGHDHCLEHIDAAGVGVPLILTGAGMSCCYGASNTGKVPANSLKFSVTKENKGNITGGFGSFDVTETRTVVTYHDQEGRALYSAPPITPRRR